MNNEKQQLRNVKREQNNMQEKRANPVSEVLKGLLGGILLIVVAVIVCTLILGMKIFP